MRTDIQRDRARSLRKNMTSAERVVWNKLKNRQLNGFRFHRQVEIGPYIVDFLCRERMLVFEIDGATHEDVAADARRTVFLEARGYEVRRTWNSEVYENLNGVMDGLLMALETGVPRYRRKERADTPPPPLRGYSPSKAEGER